MTLRPSTEEDYDAMHEYIAKDVVSAEIDVTTAKQALLSNLSWTLEDEHGIIGIGGVVLLHSRCGEAWAIVARRKPMVLTKGVKQGIKEAMRSLDRMQMMVRSDKDNWCKWATVLGFKHEGTMHKYGADGHDYERYAIWQA